MAEEARQAYAPSSDSVRAVLSRQRRRRTCRRRWTCWRRSQSRFAGQASASRTSARVGAGAKPVAARLVSLHGDRNARGSAQERERAAGAAGIVAGAAAAARLSPEPPLDPVRLRPAGLQLLPRLAGHAAAVPRPRSVQPVLPPASERGPREGDHVEGDGDPGHVHAEGAVRGVEADDAFPDGDSGVCRQRRPVAAAPAKTRGRQCPAAGYGSALVAEPAARLRADAPLRLPALLADAACGKRSERARLVRPLARTPVSAVRRPRHVRGRRGDRRGEGGADRGRRLPPSSREVPKARRSDTARRAALGPAGHGQDAARTGDRKSTRLNSSHITISYAVFCLKKKKKFHQYILSSQKKKTNIHTHNPQPPV